MGIEAQSRRNRRRSLAPENRIMAVAGIGLLFIGVGLVMVYKGYDERNKWLGYAKWLAWALLTFGVFYILIGAVLTVS